jgi:hypothetical protein
VAICANKNAIARVVLTRAMAETFEVWSLVDR